MFDAFDIYTYLVFTCTQLHNHDSGSPILIAEYLIQVISPSQQCCMELTHLKMKLKSCFRMTPLPHLFLFFFHHTIRTHTWSKHTIIYCDLVHSVEKQPTPKYVFVNLLV